MATEAEWMQAARLYMRAHPCEYGAHAAHQLPRLLTQAEHAMADRQAAIFGSDDEGTAYADLDEG